MTQKFERVELEVVRGGQRVPAHPAFKQAFEALPNLDTRGPLGQALKGRPWGVPQEVWLSSEDLVALGVPAERGPFREYMLRARLFTTQTKRRGELMVVTALLIPRVQSKEFRGELMVVTALIPRVQSKDFLPAGVMGLRSSLATTQRDRSLGNDLRFWQWRCRTHEDCLATPELGVACLEQRGGPGFVPRADETR